jgi:hypothetical protein
VPACPQDLADSLSLSLLAGVAKGAEASASVAHSLAVADFGSKVASANAGGAAAGGAPSLGDRSERQARSDAARDGDVAAAGGGGGLVALGGMLRSAFSAGSGLFGGPAEAPQPQASSSRSAAAGASASRSHSGAAGGGAVASSGSAGRAPAQVGERRKRDQLEASASSGGTGDE